MLQSGLSLPHHFVFHALVTPLTTITLNCELLTQGDLHDSEKQQCLLNIKAQQLYLRKFLVSDWTEHRQYFDFYRACHEVILRYHRPFARETVIFCCTGQKMKLYGNPLMLQEMLSCLVTNALEAYLPTKKKKVVVAASATDRQLTVTITDAGRGWKTWHRLHTRLRPKSTKPNHRGIGYRFCQQAVRHFNGKIKIYGQPGIGTSVSLYLELSNQNRG